MDARADRTGGRRRRTLRDARARVRGHWRRPRLQLATELLAARHRADRELGRRTNFAAALPARSVGERPLRLRLEARTGPGTAGRRESGRGGPAGPGRADA